MTPLVALPKQPRAISSRRPPMIIAPAAPNTIHSSTDPSTLAALVPTGSTTDATDATDGIPDAPAASQRAPSAYPLVAHHEGVRRTTITFGDDAATTIGGTEIVVIAGPCSVEGRAMMLETATGVQEHGAQLLRGGAFKPRTSPYAFQGLGEAGLEILAATRAATGMPVVTEVTDPRQVALVCRYADVLQIGARNMQNFALLTEVGLARTPVLLKRGMSATTHELLMAAEYVMAQGNREVMLCERGIRTYETSTRNTLDVAAIPVLKRETHLPVLVDPSHAAGDARLVAPLAMAAIAAGADGLIVEVHPDPASALSDGPQSLTPAQFGAMMRQLALVASSVGRTLDFPTIRRSPLSNGD